MSFEVWAPRASRMTLQLAESAIDMEKTNGGWWQPREAVEWAPDLDYGYLVDDETTPLPDPRSRRQPSGVHALSRTFDPSAHSWKDASWTGRQLAGGIIYELHIGTFTPGGTLDTAIAKLDHLVDIGVHFVELLPVNAFNGTHNWGYDGVLWYAVHEGYGGPAAYQRFVDACHARGLGVIQDVVYNHLGPSGNYLPRFGPYLSDASANTWGSSVNLDGADSIEVRRFILDNAMMWFSDFHVDGLRLDAVHALIDSSNKHILKELAEEADAASAHLRRPLTLIAESDLNDPTLITPREAGGYGLAGQWSDDFHHAVHVNLTGETSGYYADFDSLAALGKAFTKGFFHDGTYSSFRGRDHGTPIDTESTQSWRLVTFAQDHDQIGNRAIGDRLTATLDEHELAIAAVLTLASPFTPMLFMGEEWGASTPWQFFTSHPEPELGRATAEGRIAEFERMGWDPSIVPDPQAPETFAHSKLDWAESTRDHHGRLLEVYRSLAVLRRTHPSLTDPRFTHTSCEWDESARWFRVDRGATSVLVNFGSDAQAVPCPNVGEVLFATRDGVERDGNAVSLPGRTAAIVAVSERDSKPTSNN